MSVRPTIKVRLSTAFDQVVETLASFGSAGDFAYGLDHRVHRASCPKAEGGDRGDERWARIILDNRDGHGCSCLLDPAPPTATEEAARKLGTWLASNELVLLVNRRSVDQMDVIAVQVIDREWHEAGYLGRFSREQALPLIGLLGVHRHPQSVREAGFTLDPGFEHFLRERVAPTEWHFGWMDHRDKFTVYVR